MGRISNYSEWLLNEVRLTAKPYTWHEVDTKYSAECRFTTDSGEAYQVHFTPSQESPEDWGLDDNTGCYDVGFYSDTAKMDTTMIGLTNRHEQYRVLATVADIIEDFIASAGNELTFISMYGAAKDEWEDDEQFNGVQTQRTKVYAKLMRDNFPQYTIEVRGNTIVIWIRK
jgi:hypothetical protein